MSLSFSIPFSATTLIKHAGHIVWSSRIILWKVPFDYFLDNGQQSSNSNEKKPSLPDVPRLPRELTPFAPFINVVEVDQRGPLFQGPGAKRDTGRYKVRSSDDDSVKRAKKFAMEQSVKYVLVKQQQQQQRAQLDLIKKQQALLLMCR